MPKPTEHIKVPTRAQGDLLRHIQRNGCIGPDAESDVGCQGAALNRVFDAIYVRGWIEGHWDGHWGAPIHLTATGLAALASLASISK